MTTMSVAESWRRKGSFPTVAHLLNVIVGRESAMPELTRACRVERGGGTARER
jgi:hypothetical protein